MDGIFCNNCGAELDEAPTLLPEQRPPCPNCGSLARRFERTISDSITIRPADIVSSQTLETPTLVVQAQPAEVTFTAHDAEAQTAEGTGTAYDATVRITDHLVVAGRYVRWTQLTGKPDAVWLVEVLVDGSDEPIDSGTGDNQDDALLAVIDSLRPPDPA
jgi:hypothetical protein